MDVPAVEPGTTVAIVSDDSAKAVSVAERLGGPRREPRGATPQDLAIAAVADRERQSELLSVLGLWDCRRAAYETLSDDHRAACRLLAGLSAEVRLALFEWERLGLRRLDRAWRELVPDRSWVIATHAPHVASRCDRIVVLDDEEVRFDGSPAELVEAAKDVEVIVHTGDLSGVRAMVEPFAVSVEPCHEGLKITAKRGQDLAAKLLTEGYGSVRATIVRNPTIEEALAALL